MLTFTKDTCRFFVKPIGVESNQRLVELLGQAVYADEQYDQESATGVPENGYEVSMDQLVTIFESSRRNSGLKYEFRARIRGVLNPIMLVPDQSLASVNSLVALTTDMVRKAFRVRRSVPASHRPGSMPYNVLPQERHPRRIRPVRARTK